MKKPESIKKIIELKITIQNELADLNIPSGSHGITNDESILLQITDLYIIYRIFKISRKQTLNVAIENLCRSVVSISCYVYFEQKNYKKIISLYNQAAILRDELFYISTVLSGNNIEPYIKNTTNWKILDIFETSLAIKDPIELENVLRGKL